MFDYANFDDKFQLRKLWMACFNEPKASADFFLSHLFNPYNTLVWRDKGLAVAMMTLLEVSLKPGGVKGFYLYAVATLPEYRRRGIMRAMDAYAEEIMQRRGGRFACLVPAEESLWPLYQKLGYEPSNWMSEHDKENMQGLAQDYGIMHCGIEQFRELRSEFLEKQSNWMQQSDCFLNYVYDEIKFYNGDIVTFREEGKLCYAVFSVSGQTLILRECSGHKALTVAAQLMRSRQLRHYKVLSPCSPDHKDAIPFAMSKVLGNKLEDILIQIKGSYMALYLD